MEIYACEVGNDVNVYLCLADSRRKAMAKFKADHETEVDMRTYGYKVGKLADIRPDYASNRWFVSGVRCGNSARLIVADRRLI